MSSSVDIDEDAICGESLRTVACHGISMIKMPVLGRVELNGSAVFQAEGDLSRIADWRGA